MASPFRAFGLVCLFAGLLGIPAYTMYINTSGEVVANAAMVKHEHQPGEDSFKRYFREFSYQTVEFSPVELSPEMGELKFFLNMRGRLIPSHKELPYSKRGKLKPPVLELRRSDTGEVVLRRDDLWVSTQDAKDKAQAEGKSPALASSSSNHQEGVVSTAGSVEKERMYNLGRLTVPAAGSYILSGHHIVFRDTLGLKSVDAEDFRMEVRSGALDFNMQIIGILAGVLALGVIILAITRPQQDTGDR